MTLGHPVKALKTGFVDYRAMYSTELLKGVAVAEDAIRDLEKPVLNFLSAHKRHSVFILAKDRVSIGLTTEVSLYRQRLAAHHLRLGR